MKKKIKESGGKLLDISNDYLLLIIINVCLDDVGEYRFIVINVVWLSISDVIVLGILISYFVNICYFICLVLICNFFCWWLKFFKYSMI